MALRPVLSTLALAALLAAPAAAQDKDHQRHRQNDNQQQQNDQHSQAEARSRRHDNAPQGDHAVQRTQPPQDASRQDLGRRQDQGRAAEQTRAAEQQRRANDQARVAEQARVADQARAADRARVAEQQRRDTAQNYRYDNRGSDNRRYDNNRYNNGNWRRYDSHNNYHYYFGTPHVIHPTVIRVAPYRPYVYRPSYSIGVFYGTNGYYPYGYTPSYYYDPIPGRLYGGVRITGAPRDAHVFADGYYVGIVDDFDGIFQHINLEVGPHHIEVEWGGYQPIAFDVYVRPGETTTFRADGYFRG